LNEQYKKALQRDRRVKVFGERNTGTRAVMKMLRALEGVSIATPTIPTPDLDMLLARAEETLTDFHLELFRDALEDIRRSRFGAISDWKHAAPQIDDSYAAKSASVLFLVRDPYSWMVSFYRNPYHSRAPKPDTIEGMLRQPWLALERDHVERVLLSPMMLWNAKLRAYRDFANAAPVPSAVLYFEDFVRAPVPALKKALSRFDISADGLAEIEETTKETGMNRATRMAYYQNEDWKKELTPEAVQLINTYVDWDVATSFGYKLRTAEDFT